MRDPFTEPMIVECKVFGQYRMCSVVGTKEAKDNPLPPYEMEALLYVERVEDMYASHHYAGKNAVRLTKQNWKRAYI